MVLAKELNIPASTIRGYRNSHGIFTKTKFSPDPEEFIAKYHELQSQQAMAEYYGYDHHAISNYSKEIGFDDSIYKRQNLTLKQIDYIIKNYNIYSANQIGKDLNINPNAVTGVWFRAGLRGKDPRVYILLNEDYFDNINSQDKAYFTGFICADGCIYKPKNENKQSILRICIHKQDIKLLELLRQYLGTNKKIGTDKNKYVSLEISSDQIINAFEKIGISERKTWGNTIPNIDYKLMPAFIRGYLDGDGSIGLENNKNSDVRISFAGYYKNLEKIQSFLLSKNIFSNFTIDKRKYTTTETGDFGSLIITNRTGKYCFLKLIYENCENCYLDRKYEIAKLFINYIEKSNEPRDKQIKIYYDYAVHGIS